MLSYQQIDTLQPFSLPNAQPKAGLEQQQQPAQPQPPSQSADAKHQQAVEPLHLPSISSFQDHCCKQFKGPFQDHTSLPKTTNGCCLKKSEIKKHYTAPDKTLWPQTQRKMNE